MNRRSNPDPYNGFKDDRERRLALNVQAITQALSLSVKALSFSVAMVAVSLANPGMKEKIEWFLKQWSQ